MDYIVQKREEESYPTNEYDFFKIASAVSEDNKEVNIKQRVDTTSKERLESERSMLESQLADVKAKITEIDKLEGVTEEIVEKV